MICIHTHRRMKMNNCQTPTNIISQNNSLQSPACNGGYYDYRVTPVQVVIFCPHFSWKTYEKYCLSVLQLHGNWKNSSSLEKALITPIYKKGIKCLVDNYRSVSLKLIRPSVKDNSMVHSEMILLTQYEFLPGRSSTTNFLE